MQQLIQHVRFMHVHLVRGKLFWFHFVENNHYNLLVQQKIPNMLVTNNKLKQETICATYTHLLEQSSKPQYLE